MHFAWNLDLQSPSSSVLVFKYLFTDGHGMCQLVPAQLPASTSRRVSARVPTAASAMILLVAVVGPEVADTDAVNVAAADTVAAAADTVTAAADTVAAAGATVEAAGATAAAAAATAAAVVATVVTAAAAVATVVTAAAAADTVVTAAAAADTVVTAAAAGVATRRIKSARVSNKTSEQEGQASWCFVYHFSCNSCSEYNEGCAGSGYYRRGLPCPCRQVVVGSPSLGILGSPLRRCSHVKEVTLHYGPYLTRSCSVRMKA
eukprot:1191397-Prorocentrum_minimum.AAC.2